MDICSDYRPIPPHAYAHGRRAPLYALAVFILVLFNYVWILHDFSGIEELSIIVGPESVKQIAGYLPSDKGDMFFWLFESRNNPAEDPLLIWLQGGPGCSSELGLITENGPFLLRDGHLVHNPYSWNSQATVMYVDQPVGVGYSLPESGDCDSTECSAADFHVFLSKFYKKYPEYAGLPLYLSGESYGGHYVPSFAHYIKKLGQFQLNGIIIGNGLFNSVIQFGSYLEYATRRDMISDVYKAKKIQIECDKQAKIHTSECVDIMEFILDNGRLNPYDVTQTSADFEESWAQLNSFMNGPLQKQLGVDTPWIVCSENVEIEFGLKDVFLPYDGVVGELLDNGVPILIYAGRDDLSCNYVGQRRWMKQMKWSGQHAFNQKKMEDWKNGKGYQKRDHGLWYIEILNAGHMVPQRQPIASLQMVNEFMQDNSE